MPVSGRQGKAPPKTQLHLTREAANSTRYAHAGLTPAANKVLLGVSTHAEELLDTAKDKLLFAKY